MFLQMYNTQVGYKRTYNTLLMGMDCVSLLVNKLM